MTNVTAKVRCNTKKVWGGVGAQFEFGVDYADGRNKEWAQSTPSLSLNISVNNENMFEVGRSYTLTFSTDEDGE